MLVSAGRGGAVRDIDTGSRAVPTATDVFMLLSSAQGGGVARDFATESMTVPTATDVLMFLISPESSIFHVAAFGSPVMCKI